MKFVHYACLFLPALETAGSPKRSQRKFTDSFLKTNDSDNSMKHTFDGCTESHRFMVRISSRRDIFFAEDNLT